MTRKLILMRHAKSGWDDPTLSDKERTLTPRGRRSAKAIGNWLREKGHKPDLALISGSQRTRETWELLNLSCAHDFLDALYHAPPDRIETIVQNRGGNARTILVIAHNPGIGSYASDLCPDNREYDFLRYPTGATAVFDLKINSWNTFASGDITDVGFVAPRSLIPDQQS